jgi:hypothetical protein
MRVFAIGVEHTLDVPVKRLCVTPILAMPSARRVDQFEGSVFMDC